MRIPQSNQSTFEGDVFMSTTSNQPAVPNARAALNKFKMEAAQEVGVNLKQGYNGDLSSKDNGYVGGYMVRKMIEDYQNAHK